MDVLEDLPPGLAVARACDALGASRATLYRRTAPPAPPKPRLGPPARALGPDERAAMLAVLHSPEFVDQPPREVYAALLSRGTYLGSVRTMYRVLAQQGESTERRRGHEHKRHAVPQLEATGPNQIWTWDITKVHGTERGAFYFIFVILDLFSRFVVGWLVAETENAKLATHLIAETVRGHGIEPKTLTIHSDRGSPMTAGSMTQLLASLAIEQSLSRPRVSNDNPFVESHFKTAKYQPDFPAAFVSSTHVRGWFHELFAWYNEQHHHQGLALFTPADVFHGRVEAVAARRQAALDEAFEAHPERFVHGPPTVRRPPARVHINMPLDPTVPSTGTDVEAVVLAARSPRILSPATSIAGALPS